MYKGKIIFAQLMDYLPRESFDACVKRYRGNHKVQGFSCRDQFLVMAFAQLTLRSSLRGIESTPRANRQLLYHMGFRCETVSRNTLANANETRPWQIYADFAKHLMHRVQILYADEPRSLDIDACIFALDSTSIDLYLERFFWGAFGQKKTAMVKMHVLLDIRGNIPEFVVITPGKVNDMVILDDLDFLAGAFYIMDRGYMDFQRLYRTHENQEILSASIFQKMPILQAFSEVEPKINESPFYNQLPLLD